MKKVNYKNFNKTILFICLGMFFLPVIISISKKISPETYDSFRCFYYSATGKPCAFCGITTDFKSILKGDIFAYKYNLASVPLMIIFIGEIIFRGFILKKIEEIKLKRVVIYDITIHAIIIISLVSYMILFFKLGLARFS